MAHSTKKSTGSSGGNKRSTKAKKSSPKKKTSNQKNTKNQSSAAKTSSAKKPETKQTAAASHTSDGIRMETIFMGLLLICILLMLSNFNMLGKLGGYLRSVQFGLFGTTAYLVPIYIGSIFVYFMMDRGVDGYISPLRVLSSIGFLVSICAMAGLLGGNGLGEGESYTLAQCYQEATLGFSGGVFGGILYLNLFRVIGLIGTYVVLLILIMFFGMALRGKPIIQPMQRSAERMRERAEEQRRYNEEEAELARQEEELRWEEEELERKEAYRRLEARRNDLEKRRTELRARSLAFGEATKLEPPEEESSEEANRSGAQNDGRKPAKKKKKTSVEQIPEEQTRTGAGEGLRVGTVTGKQTRKTLRELEELDRYNEEEEVEQVAVPAPEREILLPDLVIHGTNVVSDRSEAERVEPKIPENRETVPAEENSAEENPAEEPAAEQTAPVQPWGRGAAAVTTPDEKTEEEILFLDEEDRNARKVLVEKVVARHPAAEEFTEDEAMAGYDEFTDVPDPEAVLRGEVPSPTAPEKKSRKSAFSTSGGSVWADQSNIGSNSGRVFHGTASGSEEDEEPIRIQEAPVVKKEYEFPALSLLNEAQKKAGTSEQSLRETAQKLQQTLSNFGVGARVTDLSCGPTVTRYELSPDQGVKVRRIVDLADDIKLNLAAADIRIEAPIPGKAAVGIEVPNEVKQMVSLKELVDSDEFRRSASKVSFGVGKDIGGKVITADLARMPHLLIAGATGSGKSVCINSIIVSILYKAHPDDVKLIMIDPKVVELSVYNGIPHLLIPVVTDPKKAAGALNWAVTEMTDRYKRFADTGCRDIKGFNKMVEERDDGMYEKMPQIVVIVDELADLMMVAAGEVEEAICRLAQLARAAGIHLVLATQRPSVNVITGLIKANVPSRIAFAVSSGTDSRTILDMNGAEKLLGYGDMLFYPSGYPKPVRIQGAFVSDEEVQRIVEFLKSQGEADSSRAETIAKQMSDISRGGGPSSEGDRDDLFEQAGRYIIEAEKASIGNLQRKFRIGFNRAARIMDQLCDYGVVGPEEGTKARQILMTMEQFNELLSEI